MAAAVAQFELAVDDRVQYRMEADVRRMLRRADDPLRLAAFPLAQKLSEATGIPNAREALTQVIDAAFRGVWPETRLRDLLLTPDREGHVFRRDAAERLQVSTRHLQRRRAKAVSILALHVRRLVGATIPEALGEAVAPPADPLEAMAELVADIEPNVAARILRAGSPQSAEKATTLAIRAHADRGSDAECDAACADRYAFSPLFAILRAQAKQINGKESEAKDELWPVFTRAARDTTNSPEVQFELEWLAFLRARHRGGVRQLNRIATNLNRIADRNQQWQARALLAQAEAQIRGGRLQDASVLLDRAERHSLSRCALRQLGSSSVLRGEMALQRGDDAQAERLAAGAYAVLRERHSDAYRSQATMARAALRLGKPWTWEDEPGVLCATAWDYVAVRIETARHFNAGGFAERARACAGECYRIASDLSYDGLAARAAATVGATFDNGTRRRRGWYLRALSHLLATRDRSIGCDLFPLARSEDDAPHVSPLDDALGELLFVALKDAIPQLLCGGSVDEAPLAIAFLNHLSAYALGYSSPGEDVIRAIQLVVARADSFSQYAGHFAEETADVLEVAYAAVCGKRDRGETDRRLGFALRAFAAAVPSRDDVRRFSVG